MKPLWPLFDHWRYTIRHPGIKAGLISLALVLVLTAAAMAYWWPAEREHRNLITQIETQRRAAVDALKAADVWRAYRRALAGVEALEKKLNASSGQADLVKNIERIAAKHRIRIVSQSFEETKSVNGFLPLYLDIGVQADYSALRAFLADLHNLPVWVEIQEMNLERSRDSAGLIKAGFRLLTYRKAAKRHLARAP